MKRLQVILNMRRISYCYCAFLVLLAEIMQIPTTFSACNMWNEPRGYGKLYANIKSKQNCTWSLLPPSNRTKVILVLKAVHFQKVNRSQTYMQRVILPDGSMGNNISRQWYGSTTASLWCGMYVAPESYHNSCPINVAISSICASNTTRSQKWPPEIFAQISNFRILLLYEYIDCSCNVRTDATAVVTAATKSSLTTRSDVAESVTIANTSGYLSTPGTNERHQLPHQNSYQVAAFVVGTAFLLTIIALLIISIKYCHLRSDLEKETLITGSPPACVSAESNSNATLGSKQDTKQIGNGNAGESGVKTKGISQEPQISFAGGKTNDPIYFNNRKSMEIFSSQSEVVENVLYGTTSEKMQVDNDLYNI